MKSAFSVVFLLLLFSCSRESEHRVQESQVKGRQSRQLVTPDLSVKVVNTELLSFDHPLGTMYEVTVELTNNGDQPFDRLYYSCEHPLRPTNEEAPFAQIDCNASSPMFRRMQPGGKMREKISFFVENGTVSTRISWRITASNFLKTDEAGSVIEDYRSIKRLGDWTFETEEITIPAKK